MSVNLAVIGSNAERWETAKHIKYSRFINYTYYVLLFRKQSDSNHAVQVIH